ncbi:stage V sporulation protein AB [Paenibacillus cisolokensis]|jgi:stage V sporulation protein AB|uniref:Stage V sporulation protein AB n=1 Tax=Paenibacillus cisolokensis TaxID=1658519 RepID=A0ABQ4NBI8_9BACL|nr:MULTISPECIES: stage V sporulation protein AB [Paenibacillus]ALS27708.1 stage V sporulation protein AB [Paenibacillus sp. 32O-W]GIQ65595.1 stage V sporulation protein AB [Paenibacillus cisolokensis]
MAEWAANGFIAFLGIAGGVAVGSGMVALLIVLDLIPRLAQIACAYRHSVWFETAVIAGSLYWTFADFLDWKIHVPARAALSFVGLIDGIFIGMLAAALTEVMNVIPILAKRLNLSDYLVALLMAMALGKTAGSLFDWLVYQR